MKIKLVKFHKVDSTNNVAIRRIKSGKIDPTLIIANSQKKGEVNTVENGYLTKAIFF